MPSKEKFITEENIVSKLLSNNEFFAAWEEAIKIANEAEREKILTQISDSKKIYILKKIAENEHLSKLVQTHPILVRYFEEASVEIFNHPEYLDVFVEEVLLKEEADAESRVSLKKRLETEPLATEEEIKAGVYWENLEPQVREAMIKLNKKGYNTFESGFESYRLGAREQFFSIFKDTIPLSCPDFLIKIMKSDGITVVVDNTREDRDSLRLISDKKMTISDWQRVWNLLAEHLPVREMSLSNQILKPTVSFIEQFKNKQEKIRRGESVYIGYDYWLENGKVIEK